MHLQTVISRPFLSFFPELSFNATAKSIADARAGRNEDL